MPAGPPTARPVTVGPSGHATNAPATIDGDYVIAGAGVPALSKSQHALIIAYKLGATGGKLPDTVGP